MRATRNPITRRDFMFDLGRGALAVAVLGFAACSDNEPTESTVGSETPAQTTSTSTTSAPGDGRVSWERVNLGFVSAYILARRGEATVVDTGVEGSEEAIAAGLARLDLGWDDVGHVIVTHLHNDHQGSLPAVMNLAPDAEAYAGAADIAGITAPRELVAVGNGDRVFDLEIIETPGHTPGHISVLDPVGGLLVAGDALNGADGGVIGANPEFTADLPTADESIRKLATLTYDTVVFGHGEPVVGGASQAVAALADSI